MSEPMAKRMADAAERAVIALRNLEDALRNLEDAVASAVRQPGERLPSHEQAAQVLGDPETAEGAL